MTPHVLGICGVLLPVAALLSPNSGLPLIGVLMGIVTMRPFWRDLPKDILIPLSGLVGVGIISSFWSLDPWLSFLQGLKLLVLLSFGFNWISFCLHTSEEKFFLNGMVIGLFITMAFIIIDHQLGNPFVRLCGKGDIKTYVALTVFAALSFYPLCFWLQDRRGLVCALLATGFTFACFLSVDVDMNIVALVLGGLALVVTLIVRSKILEPLLKVALSGLLFLFPVCMAVLTLDNIQSFNHMVPTFSFVHRVHIWRYLGLKIFQSPFIGYGLGTGKLESLKPDLYAWTFIEKTGQPSFFSHSLSQNPLFYHPHNAVLQTWLETGIVGTLLLAYFLLKLVSHLCTLQLRQRLLGFSYVTVVLSFSLGSVDMLHTWWLSAVLLSVGTVVLVNRPQPA